MNQDHQDHARQKFVVTLTTASVMLAISGVIVWMGPQVSGTGSSSPAAVFALSLVMAAIFIGAAAWSLRGGHRLAAGAGIGIGVALASGSFVLAPLAGSHFSLQEEIDLRDQIERGYNEEVSFLSDELAILTAIPPTLDISGVDIQVINRPTTTSIDEVFAEYFSSVGGDSSTKSLDRVVSIALPGSEICAAHSETPPESFQDYGDGTCVWSHTTAGGKVGLEARIVEDQEQLRREFGLVDKGPGVSYVLITTRLND